MPAPSNYANNGKWSFIHNYSEKKAILAYGENSINVAVRFSNLEVSCKVDLLGKLAELQPGKGEQTVESAEPPCLLALHNLDQQPNIMTPQKDTKRTKLTTAGRAPPKPPPVAAA